VFIQGSPGGMLEFLAGFNTLPVPPIPLGYADDIITAAQHPVAAGADTEDIAAALGANDNQDDAASNFLALLLAVIASSTPSM
jgi:hypothetical protein